MSDIYILFLKEADTWKDKIADIAHKDDLIYLLCGDQKREPGSPFFPKGRKVKRLFYQKDSVSEVTEAVVRQYEMDKGKYLPGETRIILLSGQKRYFQKLKIELLKSISAVGYLTGPERELHIKKKSYTDTDEIKGGLVPAEPVTEIKEEESVKTMEETLDPGEDERVSYSDLKEAKAAVCYYLSRRIAGHIEEKTGAKLNTKEVFDLMELVIKCGDRKEFIDSWDTISNKSVLPREEAFQALKKEAEYYLLVSDCLYTEDSF